MAGLDQAEARTGGEDDPRDREVATQALKCTKCGAPYTLRGFANTKSYACAYCGSVLDTTSTAWQIVDKVERKRQTKPIWPLGQKGKLGGKTFELVGWMERFVLVDGRRYSWEEHLFFNPFHGYRYLVFQDGHFQVIEPLPGFPSVLKLGANAYTATYESRTYRHFTTGTAKVSDVVGEFPWRVKLSDSAVGYDFVDPPSMLSCEEAGSDVVWSRGTYMTQDEVWNAIGTPGRPVPTPKGIYPNQPNPWGEFGWLGKATAVSLLAWFLFTFVYIGRAQDKTVLTAVVPPKAAPAAAATPAPGATPDPAPPPGHSTFELVLDSSRDPATVEIQASAGVSNAWAYCDCALIDTVHEHAYPFGVEVSYYEGYDDGEHWSEGSRSETIELGAIPNGKYLLQVERGDDAQVPVTLTIKRDVALARYPCCSFLAIILFPAVILFLRSRFETKRWAESDHAPSSSED